uniref:Tyrosine-protein phosphatase domain-containing protein n=1 Tax=Panagrellus redivivus TaxID=6233 RepID=A0A7E4VS07_PANRE
MSQEPDDPRPADEEQSEDNEKTDVVSVTPQEVIDEINAKGEPVVQEWHEIITRYPPRIDAFLDTNNVTKNRFPNVLLYDRSRVRLKDKLGGDYYHASYVDSYDRPGGYILAQAPFEDQTESDFWRMCFQTKPSIIVLLTSLVGTGGKRMAKNFWPNAKQEREFCQGNIRVRCTSMDQDRDHDMYELIMFGPSSRGNKGSGGVRTLLIQFRKWVDDRQIPDNLLEFRAIIKIAIARAEKDERAGSVVTFVCPSGVHRCGTLAALDIILDRIAAERKVGLIETINVLRKQRYGCFTHFEHFAHVADLIVRHAVSSGIVDPTCIGVRKKN